MINSPLRLTALVAAVAVLSIPAAAQSDAAFVSALGNIPALLATTAPLKTVAQIPVVTAATPQAKGPTAPAYLWKKILEAAVNGTFSTTPEGIIMSSRQVDINDSATRYTQHFATVFSWIGKDGHEMLAGVQFIVSEYNLDEATGLLRTDDWVFGVNPGGMLFEAAHYTNNTGKKLPIKQLQIENLDLADPKTKTRYDEMLKFWTTH